MTQNGIDAPYAVKLIQYGWETITEALKHGGIITMMDRLSNPAKLSPSNWPQSSSRSCGPCSKSYGRHPVRRVLRTMMEDWANDDVKLLTWREETGKTAFEQTEAAGEISEQEYFDKAILMVAMVKAGVELALNPWSPPASSPSRLTTSRCSRNAADRQHYRPQEIPYEMNR
ncbi:MAG: hypothetical protein R2864_05650 [Syntrophotaleaceae bacterium]